MMAAVQRHAAPASHRCFFSAFFIFIPSKFKSMRRAPGTGSGNATPKPAPDCLLDWASALMAEQGQAPAAHHRLLLTELDAISRGENDRLMVLMPPCSAKSTYATIIFPTWWFHRHPTSSIISTCHTASLATHFARQVRQLAATTAGRLCYELDARSRAAAEWRISSGGDYFATGVRGPIMGRRADLAIIDDPVKNQEEADSPRIRDRIWNWYQFDLSTRLKPKAGVVLIMTRWHEDDLAGRLLARNPDEWRCLRLPAQAGEQDPLGRAPETPLWPDWEDQEGLRRRRASLGERAWSALYQQAPTNAKGALFAVDQLDFIDALPDEPCPTVRAWDLAATPELQGNDPDWTVGLKLLRAPNQRFVVVDVVRARLSPAGTEELVVATAKRDGPSVRISLPQDPAQAGKSQASWLARALAGYAVAASPEVGSKESRAVPIASQIGHSNFALLRAPWNHVFVNELREFPFGRKDDQVDALSRAFQALVDLPAQTRRTDLRFMAR